MTIIRSAEAASVALPLIVALDVCYNEESKTAKCAAVLFQGWHADTATASYISEVGGISPSVPGRFFERELPCLLAVLQEHRLTPDILVVDGFVHLDESFRPGLGQHLFEALSGRIPVVGVAKTRFEGLPRHCEVLRGQSERPLYVTSTGLALETAKAEVRGMHGKHRLPTMLKLVDQACRNR